MNGNETKEKKEMNNQHSYEYEESINRFFLLVQNSRQKKKRRKIICKSEKICV